MIKTRQEQIKLGKEQLSILREELQKLNLSLKEHIEIGRRLESHKIKITPAVRGTVEQGPPFNLSVDMKKISRT